MKLAAILTPFALLPLRALYVISDCLISPLMRLSGYRKKVIDTNLAACFPEMTPAARRGIRRRFYRNFADSIVETLKLLHISDAEMKKRIEWVNLDIIGSLVESGRSVAVYFSHCFNWEWGTSVALCPMPGERPPVFCQIYRPLRSKRFDELMLRIRSRFGTHSLPKDTALRRLIKFKREGDVTVTGFMSDQHPGHGDPGYLTTFLGQPTLMITGTETLARKLDMAVVYWDIERVSRGRYRITTRLIASDVTEVPEGGITECYTRMLEETIRRQPAGWLWSHNRWKHRPDINAITHSN